MLELAILGLLKEQALHGYELKKRLTETVGAGSAVSFGSLYPALGRLEQAGAVRAEESDSRSEPIPGTGSLGGELAAFRARGGAGRGGRSRKVYSITPRGEALFEELLAAEPAAGDDGRTFTLRLAFARYLPPELRLRMLERRRVQLLDRLTRAEARASRGRGDGYLRSLLEHDRDSLERDVVWLEGLVAQERVLADVSATPDGSATPDASATPDRSATQKEITS